MSAEESEENNIDIFEAFRENSQTLDFPRVSRFVVDLRIAVAARRRSDSHIYRPETRNSTHKVFANRNRKRAERKTSGDLMYSRALSAGFRSRKLLLTLFGW